MFQNHEPCPECGSRNNLGRYSDGSAWCFGCHYYEEPTVSRYVFDRVSQSSQARKDDAGFPRIPDDAGTSFAGEAVEWLAKFHCDIPTAIQHGVLWSPSWRQLIYQLGSVWQARNFDPEKLKQRKNFTSGDVNDCNHVYSSPDSGSRTNSGSDQKLVIVEDPLSALRIASVCDAMPLLGSHLAIHRLNAIAKLYRSLVFWLDSDKLKESREMANRAKLIGLDVQVIYTPDDPKCHTHEQLVQILTKTGGYYEIRYPVDTVVE